jgi:hypothetical protein
VKAEQLGKAMKNIAAAFINAKKAFRPALKEKANPAFKGAKYADLGSCIEAVDDALLANGIAMYQETSEDQTGVTVETVFLHESGECIRSGKLHVPAQKQDPQGYGSALTYARRYSLITACGMAPEDDDGNAASKAQPIFINGPQAERLAKLAHSVNADLPALFEWLSEKAGREIKVFNEITIAELPHVTKALEAKKEKA